jgi:predicted nuclease of predicted toxin-antitoxin system
LVTADADFVAIAIQIGPPSKLVHIERCDFPFQAIEQLLRQNAIQISEFEKDPTAGLLVLRPSALKPAR